MIYSVSGKLIAKDDVCAVLENAGMAFEIFVSRLTLEHLQTGEFARLFTKMIVREDDIFLVGFLSIEDRKLFESLMSVSGIGPKQALRILSELSASDIRNAIIMENGTLLSGVKGIGPKTASRIILELKDKMKKLSISDHSAAIHPQEKKKIETLLAMRVLGYSDNEAKKAIDSVFSASEEVKNKEVEEIIRLVLMQLRR
jgi:Holliday junction DNA helicase RuvA